MKPLITGHLEKVSSTVFEYYHQEITQLVGRHHGVYALYKHDRLYYVGLAKNLRSRVKHHLKDRHSKKWDAFSIFLIHQAEHLRELEASILHIAEPKGNKQRGKLRRSKNFIKDLENLMKDSKKREIEKILGSRRIKKQGKRTGRTKKDGPGLLAKLENGTILYTTYKGIEYTATVMKDGKISFRNQIFNSPSMAGHLITKRATNGWFLWKYVNQNGEKVLLNTLRQK